MKHCHICTGLEAMRRESSTWDQPEPCQSIHRPFTGSSFPMITSLSPPLCTPLISLCKTALEPWLCNFHLQPLSQHLLNSTLGFKSTPPIYTKLSSFCSSLSTEAQETLLWWCQLLASRSSHQGAQALIISFPQNSSWKENLLHSSRLSSNVIHILNPSLIHH